MLKRSLEIEIWKIGFVINVPKWKVLFSTSLSFIYCEWRQSILQLVVSVSLMVVVAIKHRVVDELDLFLFTYILFLLLFFIVLFLPHGRRIWSLFFSHIFIHQPVSKSIVRLLSNLFEIFSRTPTIQRVTDRFIYHLYLLWRADKLFRGIHQRLFLVSRWINWVRFHLDVFLYLWCIIELSYMVHVRSLVYDGLILDWGPIEELSIG